MDLAVSSGVVVTAFVILVPSSHTVRIAHDFHRQVEAKATGDGKVPSGRRAQPPPWDVDVSWATGISIAIIFANASPTFISGSAQRPGAKQARFFQLGVESGSICGVEHHIAEQVVPARAVPTSTANQRMVSLAVEHAIADRTLHK